MPNRFLPFPHDSHVLRVPGPGAHPWPGAAGPSTQLRERVPAGTAAAAGVTGYPPANRSGPCTEVGGAGSTPTVPGARGERGSAPRGRERAGRLAAVAACACALGLFFTKLFLK